MLRREDEPWWMETWEWTVIETWGWNVIETEEEITPPRKNQHSSKKHYTWTLVGCRHQPRHFHTDVFSPHLSSQDTVLWGRFLCYFVLSSSSDHISNILICVARRFCPQKRAIWGPGGTDQYLDISLGFTKGHKIVVGSFWDHKTSLNNLVEGHGT